MGEQLLFLDGDPPDFSLLQRLLCLEAELGPPLLLPTSPGGVAPTGPPCRGRGAPAPPWSPPTNPGAGLSFLRETARLLDLPAEALQPPAAPPDPAGAPPGPLDGPDALSLIALQCRHLARDSTSSGTETSQGAGDGSGNDISCGSSKDAGNGTSNSTGTSKRAGDGACEGDGTSAGDGIDNGTSKSIGSPSAGAGPSSGRRRKQAAPQRGAEPGDPLFRGVTLRLRLEPPAAGSPDGYCVRISARPGRVPHHPTPVLGGSSSEDETPLPQGSKRCGSCKTRRTPLWRAAENGTPLCNACGIRFRKYRLRCRHCGAVPGRSGTPWPQCPQCGQRCLPPGTGRR